MRSVNKVILIGNLTRDPEMRQTPNGQNVTTFSIATNREWITRDNKKHSLAEYHDLVAWAKLAEICQKYLKKGKLVYVEGYLKTRNWETPEGIKKFKTEIVVQDMIMLDKKPNDTEEDYIPEDENTNGNLGGSKILGENLNKDLKESPGEEAPEKKSASGIGNENNSKKSASTTSRPASYPASRPERKSYQKRSAPKTPEEKKNESPAIQSLTDNIDIDKDLGL